MDLDGMGYPILRQSHQLLNPRLDPIGLGYLVEFQKSVKLIHSIH